MRRRLAKLLRNQKDVHYSDGMPSLDGIDQVLCNSMCIVSCDVYVCQRE